MAQLFVNFSLFSKHKMIFIQIYIIIISYCFYETVIYQRISCGEFFSYDHFYISHPEACNSVQNIQAQGTTISSRYVHDFQLIFPLGEFIFTPWTYAPSSHLKAREVLTSLLYDKRLPSATAGGLPTAGVIQYSGKCRRRGQLGRRSSRGKYISSLLCEQFDPSTPWQYTRHHNDLAAYTYVLRIYRDL
jgi:hypothetical protein